MSRQALPEVPEPPMELLYRGLAGARRPPVSLGGTPSVPLPQHVLDAVAASTSQTGYAPQAGVAALREALAESLTAEGIAIEQDRIVVTAGAMQALHLVLRLTGGPGRSVAMPRPGFFIDGIVNEYGGSIVGIPSLEGEGGRPDWDAARALVTDATSCLYVNTPVNPTGYVFTEQDRRRVHELAEEFDLWLITDEAHTGFVYSPEGHHSLWSPELAERTILIRSFSKDYAMAGWRVGYAVAPPPLARAMVAMLERQTVATNRLGQAAALAALTGPQEWRAELAVESHRRGRILAETVDAVPGFSCAPPQGGLALFPRCDGDSGEAASTFVTELGIPALPGEMFHVPGFVRLQFGGTLEALEEAVRRIRDHDWSSLAGNGGAHA